MANPLILSFEYVRAHNVPTAVVGGKGKQLSTICGFTQFAVPPGGVIPAEVYRNHLERVVKGMQRPGYSSAATVNADFVSAVRASILASDVPADLYEAVDIFTARLAETLGRPAPDLRFAVRSSGVLEDGAAASFAGQYDSVLNVVGGGAAICEAVKRVWASQWSEHILTYLTSVAASTTAAAEASGGLQVGGVAVPDMAVVIQVQVRVRNPVSCNSSRSLTCRLSASG